MYKNNVTYICPHRCLNCKKASYHDLGLSKGGEKTLKSRRGGPFSLCRRFFHSTFFLVDFFFLNLLSQSVFFSLNIIFSQRFSFSLFVQIGVFFYSALFPADVLYFSMFCLSWCFFLCYLLSQSLFLPFYIMSHSAFCLTFWMSTFFYFEFLSVNPGH
jgi:hypothetical protein